MSCGSIPCHRLTVIIYNHEKKAASHAPTASSLLECLTEFLRISSSTIFSLLDFDAQLQRQASASPFSSRRTQNKKSTLGYRKSRFQSTTSADMGINPVID